MNLLQKTARISAIGALAAAALAAAPAGATVLAFNTDACVGGCTNGAFISQAYGDTAFVDVRYDGDTTNAGFEGMRWWSSGYSDLNGVAYVGLAFASPNPTAVWLIPIAGYQITLNSFDLGSWQSAARTTQVTLRAGGDGSVLSSTGSFSTAGAAHNHYTPGLTRTDGFRIEFGPDNFNVGLDNIDFTVSEISAGIPEPSAWAILILGFGAAGTLLRRRRMAAI
jgi:hypothetical protein